MSEQKSSMKIAGDVFELNVVKGFSYWITFFTANQCDTSVSCEVWSTADQAFEAMQNQVKRIIKQLKTTGTVTKVEQLYSVKNPSVH